MLQRVRQLAAALLEFGLCAERPLAILSGNDPEHLQLAMAALYAGIPFCPVSPGYALLSQDHAKLRHVCGLLQPGLVFVSDGPAFQKALDTVLPADVPVIATRGQVQGRSTLAFTALLARGELAAAERAFAATGPDSIAKFLFTSGSTKLPKAVTTTQRMLCANQQMLLQTFPVFGEEPPVLVDWLPWNHTFGGNHNVGIVLNNGGSLYIDDGKPTPALIGETLRNLREIAPTVYFNVPTGFEAIANAMQTDAQLRRNLLSRVKMSPLMVSPDNPPVISSSPQSMLPWSVFSATVSTSPARRPECADWAMTSLPASRVPPENVPTSPAAVVDWRSIRIVSSPPTTSPSSCATTSPITKASPTVIGSLFCISISSSPPTSVA